MSVERFKIKRASFASVFPSVAGPAVGGYAGYNLGQRFGHPELGALLGTLSLGTAGKLIGEKVHDTEEVPPGAPYALDPTAADIPPWALQGAQLLQPQLKQSAHEEREPISDVVMGEVPGANVAKETWQHGPMAGLKTFGGMALGGVPGGLLGTGVARGVEHLVGHPVRVPGLNMSLSDLLGSVGGAIGATKGLRYMQS